MDAAGNNPLPASESKKAKIPYLRWVIAFMLFAAAILNYIDRQALALLKPTIEQHLHMTDEDYATVNNLFLGAYTIAYLISGRLVDKWGPRVGMAVFLTWWSISNALTAFANSMMSLGIFRFLLGLGEAGNWPASTKAVSEWFPAKERAIAIGFYTMGATVGATVAPFLIIHLNHHFGWQATFVATGALGICWVLPWFWIYRRPDKHPRITAEELKLIQESEQAPEQALPDASKSAVETTRWQRLCTVFLNELKRWGSALSLKAVWLLMLARMLTDPLWYFYQQWFPSYLQQDWKMSQEQMAITWVIFLAADIGTLTGGFGSAWLIRRKFGASPARLYTMLACALIIPLSPLITHASSLNMALLIAMCVVAAHLAWLANISALVVDVIPRNMLATCFGIAAAGSALGGMMMNKIVAGFAMAHNYPGWFMIMAFLHPAAWLLLWFGGIHRRKTA